MPPASRQLRFAVSTSLLTASLALAPSGCKKNTVNVAQPADEPHVNEGPEPTPTDAPTTDTPSSDAPSSDAPAESPETEADEADE